MDERLQQLLDKQEITEVISRYSRTLDWLDDDGQLACYWPDAEIDYGFFKGTAAEFVPIVMEVERASARRWHMLNGVQIKLHSATSASVECYGIATGIAENEGNYAGNMFGGRYLDEFEKREGDSGPEWRIAKRMYVMDWSLPLPDQPGANPNPDFPLHILDLTKSGHPFYRSM